MGLFSEKCVQCGTRVKKGADYCSECGEPRTGSWRKCHDCGASVGAQSKVCWKCRADLLSQPTDQLFADRWRRSESDFAVRFPLRTPAGVVKHGIQVDDGTQAFLYVNGRHDKTIGPGYHVMSSFFERLTKMEKMSQHATAILVSTGPAMVSFEVDGLHDSEQVPLGAVMKLEIELTAPDKFAERAMLGRDTVGNDEIRDLVVDEIREAVRKRTSTYQIEDLLVDVSQREGLEAVLGREMRRILEPYGLDFRAVRLARFTGEGVEAIRERLGDKAIATRQYEIDREMQALHRTSRLKSIETEYEFSEVEKQLAHDYALKDSERDLFRVRWEEETGHKLTMEGLDRAKEIRTRERQEELTELRHKAATVGAEEDVTDIKHDSALDRARRAAEAERLQDERDLELAGKAGSGAMDKLKAMQELELAKKKAELDLRLAERKGMAEVDFEELRVRKEVMRGMTRDELIAVTGSAELADRYVRIEQIQAGQKPSFTPSQFNQEHRGTAGGFGDVTPGMLPPGGVPNVAGAPVVSVAGVNVGASEDQKLQDVARHMMSAVGLISVTDSDGDGAGFGTGWMVGPRVLATNAHVAADAIEAMRQGMSCWVTFGGPDGPRKARVERSVMHPKYGDPGPGPDGGKCAVPAYDVAMLVLDSDQPNVFQVAPMEKLVRMVEQRVGTRVAYLGFPMEDLAGGGASKSNPAAVMKSGIVSQVTDWWLGSTTSYQQATLIQHDLGVAGGASGSPLFDADGHVLGMVSAGNMAAGIDVTSGKVKRIPSGVMLNFAQRVDLLGELLATPEGY